MEFKKRTVFAGVLTVFAILGVIMFHDIFAASRAGAFIGGALIIISLILTYILLDDIRQAFEKKKREDEFVQRAFEDRMIDVLRENNSPEMTKDLIVNSMEKVNEHTTQTAKAVIKYQKMTSKELAKVIKAQSKKESEE